MNQGQEWTESGFPPRTFPAGAGAAPRRPQPGLVAGGGPTGPPMRSGRGRGRWLAAAAALIAVLLLTAGLVLANRGGDDDSDLAAGSSTSSAPLSVPTFETTSVVTPSSIEPVVNTTAPSPPTVGVIETSSTLTIPRFDATVGRPPQLTEGRIVNAFGQPNPCNARWFYLVKITDTSPIRSARVIARVGSANADTELVAAGQAGGASGNYQSKQFDPLPKGSSLRFAIEAFDQQGFGTRLPEQNISC